MRVLIRDFSVFLRFFFRYTAYLRGVVTALILLLALAGLLIARLEDRSLGEAIYFSYVTGLTIGYGDITPETTLGRVISILIGLIGTVFTGIIVAIATRALADAAQISLPDRASSELLARRQ